MKHTMKNLVLSMVLAILPLTCFTQQYKTALGLKTGSNAYFLGNGVLSLKQFIKGANAIEVNVGGNPSSIWLQGVYERNSLLKNNVDWYWGIGGNIAVWNTMYYYSPYSRYYYKIEEGSVAGLDFRLGLEYTFEEIPLNIVADMGPTIRTIPYGNIGWFGDVGVRYVLK